MARTIPASFTPVDPQTLLSGEPISSAALQPLGEAHNWSLAHVARCAVVAQAWPQTGGVSECRRVASTLADVAQWDMPELVGATSVDVVIVARVVAGPANATHRVQLKTTNGSGTYSLTVPSLTTTLQSFSTSLPVAFVAGIETITLRLSGDGATAVECVAVLVRYPSLTSLPAGRTSDGRVAFDDAELDADRPLSARVGAQWRANATALPALPHVHANVSDLRNVVSPGQDRLPPYRHAWLAPRMPDAADRFVDVALRLRVSTVAAGEVMLRLNGDGLGGSVQQVDVAAGKVRDIVVTTIARQSRATVSPQPFGIEWQGVGVWPQPDPSTYYAERAYMSTVDATHGLLMWSFS
jgi:hypothetical protein